MASLARDTHCPSATSLRDSVLEKCNVEKALGAFRTLTTLAQSNMPIMSFSKILQ